MEINDEKQNNFKIEKVEKESGKKVNRAWRVAKYALEFNAWGILLIVTLIGEYSCASAYEITKDTGLFSPMIMGIFPYLLSVDRMKSVIDEALKDKFEEDKKEKQKEEQECQLVKKK